MDRTSRVSDSAGLGCSPGMCISNMYPGDAAAAGMGLYFESQWSSGMGQGLLCGEFQLQVLLTVGTPALLDKGWREA